MSILKAVKYLNIAEFDVIVNSIALNEGPPSTWQQAILTLKFQVTLTASVAEIPKSAIETFSLSQIIVIKFFFNS